MAKRRSKEDGEEERPDPMMMGENDAAQRLLEAIQQFETLQEEIEERQIDQREIMRDLAGSGFDAKQTRRVIAARKARKRSLEKWETDEQVFQTYMRALGLDSY